MTNLHLFNTNNFDLKDLIKSIENKLETPVKLTHQAATIAFELFMLMIREIKPDTKVQHLFGRFFEQLSVWGLEDLIEIQADYAIRISSYNGKLEYEEMHKLFSLCDEIYALECLGQKLDKIKKRKLEISINEQDILKTVREIKINKEYD